MCWYWQLANLNKHWSKTLLSALHTQQSSWRWALASSRAALLAASFSDKTCSQQFNDSKESHHENTPKQLCFTRPFFIVRYSHVFSIHLFQNCEQATSHVLGYLGCWKFMKRSSGWFGFNSDGWSQAARCRFMIHKVSQMKNYYYILPKRILLRVMVSQASKRSADSLERAWKEAIKNLIMFDLAFEGCKMINYQFHPKTTFMHLWDKTKANDPNVFLVNRLFLFNHIYNVSTNCSFCYCYYIGLARVRVWNLSVCSNQSTNTQHIKQPCNHCIPCCPAE